MASYWNEILTAVKAQIETIEGLPPVKRRKKAAFWRDEKRVVCVSPISDEWVASEGTFVGSDARRAAKVYYTISIAVMIQANEQWESDELDPETLEWREKIRQLLDQPRLSDLQQPPLPGADTVVEVNVLLGNVYDDAALSMAYNDSKLTIVCESIEPANGPQPAMMGGATT